MKRRWEKSAAELFVCTTNRATIQRLYDLGVGPSVKLINVNRAAITRPRPHKPRACLETLESRLIFDAARRRSRWSRGWRRRRERQESRQEYGLLAVKIAADDNATHR